MTGLSGWPPRGETALSVIRHPSSVCRPTAHKRLDRQVMLRNAPRPIGQDRLPPRDWMPRDALPINPHRTAGPPITPHRTAGPPITPPRVGTADRPAPHARPPITPRSPDCRSPRAGWPGCRYAAYRVPDRRPSRVTRPRGGAGTRSTSRSRSRMGRSGCRATRDSPAVRSGGQVAEWPARSQVTSHAVRHRQAVQSGGRAFRLPRGARSSRRSIAGRVAVRRTPTTSTDPPTRRPDQATRASNPDQATPGKQPRGSNPVRRTSRRSVRAIDEPTRSGGPVARRA
jgi:hypothetical protein